jgi:hypothetical protein
LAKKLQTLPRITPIALITRIKASKAQNNAPILNESVSSVFIRGEILLFLSKTLLLRFFPEPRAVLAA